MATETQSDDNEQTIAEAREATDRAWDQWAIENRRALRAESERDDLQKRLDHLQAAFDEIKAEYADYRRDRRREHQEREADRDVEDTLAELAERQARPNGLEGVL